MREKTFRDLECAKFLASYMNLADISKVLHLMEVEKYGFGSAIQKILEIKDNELKESFK